MAAVTHRRLLWVVGLVAAGAVIGLVVLWPGDADVADGPAPGSRIEEVDATLLEVTEVTEAAGEPDEGLSMTPGATRVELTARLEPTGEIVRFEMIDETGDTFAAGQDVILAVTDQPDQPTSYTVNDFQRGRPLLLLTALFVGAVLVFSRLQGLRALVGVAFTLLVIAAFVVPAILDGANPVAAALVGAVTIMATTLYLSHGYSQKTTAAVVGTVIALAVTGALAVTFVSAASLTGMANEDARLANVTAGGLSLQGLLLAGIIIGALGVLDDVTMSQSSTVFELSRANPAAGFGELVRGALNVGRDHITATVNTLFLAYAGAGLPLLILFATGDQALGGILTSEIVAVEIVRALVGSLGLITAVPITTALAAALVASRQPAGRRAARSAARPPTRPDGDEHVAPHAAVSDEAEDDEAWEARLRERYGLAPRGPADHPDRRNGDARDPGRSDRDAGGKDVPGGGRSG